MSENQDKLPEVETQKEKIDFKYIMQKGLESLFHRRKTVLIVALTSSLAYSVGYNCGQEDGKRDVKRIMHSVHQMAHPQFNNFQNMNFQNMRGGYSNTNNKYISAESAERKWGRDLSRLQPADHNQHVIDYYSNKENVLRYYGDKKSASEKREYFEKFRKAHGEKCKSKEHKHKSHHSISETKSEVLKMPKENDRYISKYEKSMMKDKIGQEHQKNGTYDIRNSESYKQIMAKPLGPLDPQSDIN